jgi:hypothetical protein
MSWAACINRLVGGQSPTKQAAAERIEGHDVMDDAEQRGYRNLPPVPEKPQSRAIDLHAPRLELREAALLKRMSGVV